MILRLHMGLCGRAMVDLESRRFMRVLAMMLRSGILIVVVLRVGAVVGIDDVGVWYLYVELNSMSVLCSNGQRERRIQSDIPFAARV